MAAEAAAVERFTILDDGRPLELAAQVAGGRVALAPEEVEARLGWSLKPEGLCRGALCVPVRDRAALAGAQGVDLAELARALGRPLALELAERAAALGTAPDERRAALAGLEAPDFELPDLAGRRHTLSAHRGKKVLLIAYASW
jgi:hypothetical protein